MDVEAKPPWMGLRRVLGGKPRASPPRCLAVFSYMRSCLLRCILFLLPVLGHSQDTNEPLEPAVEWSLGFPQVVQAYARDPAAKSQFAVTALTEMALALSVEADLARSQLASPGSDPGLSRWVISVERYIDELLRLAQSIAIDTPIKLMTGPEGHLFLLLRGQSIVVSAPRMELQSSFEQRVVQQFCSQYPCERALERASGRAMVTRAGIGAPPRWSFSADGPSCNSDDGLVLEFESMANLTDKRELCLQLVGELRSIAAGIERLQADGVMVNWSRLAVHGIPGSEEHQLDVNAGGEALRLSLPTLAAHPELLQEVQPWLHARAAKQPHTLVLAVPEALLAPPQG